MELTLIVHLELLNIYSSIAACDERINQLHILQHNPFLKIIQEYSLNQQLTKESDLKASLYKRAKVLKKYLISKKFPHYYIGKNIRLV